MKIKICQLFVSYYDKIVRQVFFIDGPAGVGHISRYLFRSADVCDHLTRVEIKSVAVLTHQRTETNVRKSHVECIRKACRAVGSAGNREAAVVGIPQPLHIRYRIIDRLIFTEGFHPGMIG